MSNPKIGKRPDMPPTETISGGVIVAGADFVNLGGDYYGRLDLPHHKDTNAIIEELRAEVTELLKPTKKKRADNEPL